MLRLALFLLSKRPDLIWASSFATAFPAALASLYTGNRFIYCIHDNLCLTYRFPVITDTLFKWLDKWTIRQASAVIIPNARLVEKHAEPYRHKFRVFPNSPSLKKMPGDDGKHDRQPFCVYVNGSLWNTRGIEVLFKAAEQVPKCRIVIAGELPGKGIEDAIDSNIQVDYKGWLDHEEALRLYGPSKAVFAFYDPAIPINVCTSPTKFYEAMLMSKPVIINSEAHISRDVMEWKTGYTCGYHDVDGLVGILREIGDHPEEADRKGARARQLYEKVFAWEYFEPKLLELVHSLGSDGHGPAIG
jgi:glycosyltransferase involved in cell wall biosynthesis